MKFYRLLILFMLSCMVSGVNATETYITGKVTNITSIKDGLLLTINKNEKPSGCHQRSAWMLIKEENKTMVSVALATYMAGKRDAVVYVDTTASGSYCVIIQYDPLNQ